MLGRVLLLFLLLQQSSAVIYRLNETEHNRMPRLYHLDEFEPCVHAVGGVYCDVDYALVSDTPSELLALVQNYSAHTVTHFNHTNPHYGICVTKTCKKYFKENETDLLETLEACLNETLWRDYQLKSRVSNKTTCVRYDDEMIIDKGDITIAVVCCLLVFLNIIGSFYDFFISKGKEGNGFLLCFSVRKNWYKLIAPSAEGDEPRLKRLKSFNGIKALTTAMVILGHTPLSFVLVVDNSQFIEETYHYLPYQIIFNGTLIVQSFFVLSGFLLSYNFLILAEKHKITWTMLPKGIILRWLRLTPSYALVLGVTSTLLRYAGSGPTWQRSVGVEVDHCRKYWWWNIIYLNNYIDYSQCMSQTWYLAADMQLYCLGLLVCVFLKNNRVRNVVCALLLVAGLVLPAIETYLKDLDAVLLVSPETARTLFQTDPTFNNVYKRGHTNLFCSIVGLIGGYMVYNRQQNDFDIQKYKKYRFIYWAAIPAALGLILLGSIFYMDGPRIPLAYRTAYAGIFKPIYGLIGLIILIGTTFKIENVYRGLLEWRGWATPGRISYCAYLLHVLFIRTYAGTKSTLLYASFYQIAILFCGTVTITFVSAVPFWIMVESPFNQLIKLIAYPKECGNLQRNMEFDDKTNKIDIKL